MEQELHRGHRGRMRLRLKHNPESFEDHELLELLLFYSVPRQNTNETAHRLIQKFGCFRRVFDADLKQLQEVEGIGENSALFIRAISETIARYSQEAHFITHPLTSRAALKEYLCSLFVSESQEKVYLILLSSSGRILSTEVVGNGFAGLSEIAVKKMNTLAVSTNAAAAVLAHNHPDGIPTPSTQDIMTTQRIRTLFGQLGVTLIDHFVVVDNECVPILHNDSVFIAPKQASPSKSKSRSKTKKK